MSERIESIRADALKDIAGADTLQELEDIRVRALGRKGILTEILRGISEAPPDQRRTLGREANELKKGLGEAIEQRKAELESLQRAKDADTEGIDLSLPGRCPPLGRPHPISRLTDEIVDVFSEMGFQVAEGPEVETEYYNFDSLNTPSDHPARDLHDTFFVKPGVVLRTHTSPVQMRVMEKNQPPVAVVVPGRVYRVDADATHSPMFFQLEGLLIDQNVTFADLKGTIMLFIHRLLGPEVKIRFRPHFFPFTEPSAEVDILWSADRGGGAKESRWLEIMGCGMVHPEVFKYANYDYEKYSGFAFGMGVDRIAMVKYGIGNINHLYENDLRFLEQF